jgi:hypothetical protein
MNKKKWALLVLAALLVFGYIKLFYKTYNESGVAKSADCIVVIDVKRITNSIIWNFITTPGQWKIGNPFSEKNNKVALQDMFVLPDFIFAFHAKNQPTNIWYTLLTIKDKADFEKGLLQFQFEKLNNHEYLNKVYGIRFYVDGDKVLLANIPVYDTIYMAEVTTELFVKKNYTSKAILSKAIKAKSHLAVYMAANNFLQTEAIITANFDKHKIEIAGSITPHKQFNFGETNFKYSSSSLCTAGFTQPSATVYSLLTNSNKEKISAALNVQADSVFRQSNKSYNLHLAAIVQRTDSAITYTYDDEFNKVEKVVVNNIQEPAFNFTITGDSVSAIYHYLQASNKLEKTTAGNLFTPMPLVKSYGSIKNEKQLAITASNYFSPAEDESIKAILFFNLALTKIPASLQKYLPDYLMRAISNLATIKIAATKKNEQVLLLAVIDKMKNDLPLIK